MVEGGGEKSRSEREKAHRIDGSDTKQPSHRIDAGLKERVKKRNWKDPSPGENKSGRRGIRPAKQERELRATEKNRSLSNCRC